MAGVVLAQNLASYLFLAGVLLVSVSLLYRAQRRMAQSRQQMQQAWQSLHSRPQASASQTGPYNPAARWEVELHEVARGYLAELHTRSAILEQQLREARELSHRLASLLEQLRPLEPKGVEQAPPGAPWPLQGRSDARGSRARVSPPGSLASGQGEQIAALAAQGLSSAQIAAQTGRPVEEVELILRLYRLEHPQPEDSAS